MTHDCPVSYARHPVKIAPGRTRSWGGLFFVSFYRRRFYDFRRSFSRIFSLFKVLPRGRTVSVIGGGVVAPRCRACALQRILDNFFFSDQIWKCKRNTLRCFLVPYLLSLSLILFSSFLFLFFIFYFIFFLIIFLFFFYFLYAKVTVVFCSQWVSIVRRSIGETFRDSTSVLQKKGIPMQYHRTVTRRE